MLDEEVMMHKKICLALLVSVLSVGVSYAKSNYSYNSGAQTPQYQQNYYNQNQSQYPVNNTLKGRVVSVPAGQNVPVVTTTSISSSNAYLGQVFSMTLASDFYFNGAMVAPAGSNVIGNVTQVTKAKRGSINGKLSIRFNQIVTPSGMQIPISAVIRTNDNSGVLVGGTKMDVAKEYGKGAVLGSAAGALSGVVFGALAGGSIGRGAALGTAVGAGGGLVKSAWNEGKDVDIPAGSSFDIVLTQPITATPAVTDY